MAKQVSAEVREVNRAARRAAQAAGKDWPKLSQEERREYKKKARGEMRRNAKGPSSAGQGKLVLLRQQARTAAENAGEKWQDLTTEQRQAYIRRARDASKPA